MSIAILEDAVSEATVATGATPVAIPLREILPWAVFAGVILLSLLYLLGIDQGATQLVPGSYLHEFVHDGRHLLAFPCH